MAVPISYHLSIQPGGGMSSVGKWPPFTASSDANAITVAQQVATMWGVSVWVRRTDNNALLNSGAALAPAAQGAALGNSVTNIVLSPF